MTVGRTLAAAAAAAVALVTAGTGAAPSAPSAQPAATWHRSTSTANLGACDASRALYAANGYQVRPAQGCYGSPVGYYFRWKA